MKEEKEADMSASMSVCVCGVVFGIEECTRALGRETAEAKDEQGRGRQAG